MQVQLRIGDCIRIHLLANIIPARTITNVYESLSPEDSGDRVGLMVSDRGSLKLVVEGSSEIDGSGEIVGCFVGSFVGVAVAAVGGETNPLVGSNDGYDDGCDSQKGQMMSASRVKRMILKRVVIRQRLTY